MQQPNFYKDSEVDKMNPPVTVLMSVYNGLPYLPEAIDSILQQTFQDFEFLIINDASTDGSSKVLSEYAERDSRIRILTNERNMGLGYSLARGVAAATTTWIARMDADDIAVPNRLELQMDYVREHPDVDILGGYGLRIDKSGKVMTKIKVPTDPVQIYRLIWTCPLLHPTVMFRREAIVKVGSYSSKTNRNEDYDLWFRCAAAGLKFANLSITLIYYRFTDENFQRNKISVSAEQMLIGWRGCWMLRASPIAYLGVTKPFLLGILPLPFRTVVYRWLKLFDPREKVT